MKAVTPVALFALLAATPAFASEPDFSGEGLGCFGASCSNVEDFSHSDRLYLSGFPIYENLQFTARGFDNVGIGSPFVYGALHANVALPKTVNSPLAIFLSFTSPTGIEPAPIFGGNIENGFLAIGTFFDGWLRFEESSRQFTFTGPGLPGAFTLEMHDVDLNPFGDGLHGSVNLTATITEATVTPEPVSMALLGTGLAGLAAARRRRKDSGDVEAEE